ncbi:hypothetical protein KIN20_019068 [Parelaphostrongylus tenuis]|uniref:Uncharacterized protein n=1 Tax=Parelaphostrongylus tenuis TaxID=148309 RepID=A0AAD5MKU1_PARTN|nr:hypothetical protein KIN20_019068 [Parelaphostrongylus tenuis]
MVYSNSPDVQARVPGFAPGEVEARALVQRLVMQTVFDVLESQARNALLPDDIIPSILFQFTANITYPPMLCQTVRNSPEEMAIIGMPHNCIVVGNTVTEICTEMPPADSLIVMANWLRTMRQGVVTRAIRLLALGPLRSNFFSASAVVGGN